MKKFNKEFKEFLYKYIVYYVWLKYNTHNVWNKK